MEVSTGCLYDTTHLLTIKDSFNKNFIPQKWSGEEKHFDKHTNTLGHNHIQQRSFVQHTQ